jgi:hypothetical protein
VQPMMFTLVLLMEVDRGPWRYGSKIKV